MMKHYLKLWLTQLSNKIHFIVIFIILITISFYNIIYIILLFIYLLYLYKKHIVDKYLVYILLLFSIYIPINYFSYNINNINNKYTVIEVDDNRYLVRNGLSKYYINSYNIYEVGDVIVIKGKLKEVSTPSYKGDYNEKLMLFSKNIKGYIDINHIEKVGSRFTLYNIRDSIIKYYTNNIKGESLDFFLALVLAYNNLDQKAYGRLNLAHIIAISGFHISLIYNVLKNLLFKLTKNLYLSDKISLNVVLVYNILGGFSVSILKATLYLFINKANNKENILTKLDVLGLDFIILMINPKLIFNIGFILAFISSFILLYINELIKKDKYYQLKLGLLLFITLLPFTTKINNEYSLLSIISFLFFDLFSYFLIPYSFILLIIPSLSNLMEPVISQINSLISLLSNKFIITIPTIYNSFILPYYILLYFILINYNKILKLLFSVIILILIFIDSIITIDKVVFIDVNQGDSCLITESGSNMLIDCFNAYDYLVKNGIRNLDYIFITHDDLDHYKDLDKILNNISVDVVYTNPYSSVIKDITSKYNVTTKCLKRGDVVKINNNYIDVLGPVKKHKDDNENSLILAYSNNYCSFLFTGDMTTVNEVELLELKIKHYDVLKVAHHGSNTSSSIDFLNAIGPKYAIVSVGKNRYGLPHEEIINRLMTYSKVYTTLKSGNITFYKDKIVTYK